MQSNERGFTLVEVLIALAIVAVALAAAIRASGMIAVNDGALRAKALAVVAAENQLATLRMSDEFPDLGKTTSRCSQGRHAMQCEQTVRSSVNAGFREVEIRVYPDEDRGNTLVSMSSMISRRR